MGFEQPRGARLGGQVGVDAEHQVGAGVAAFQPDAIKYRHAIFQAHQVKLTTALCLKGLLDLGTRPPVAGKRVIGINRQRGHRSRRAEGEP